MHTTATTSTLMPGTAGSAVIVTSRDHLIDLQGATRLSLVSLNTAQSLELLSEIIGADRVKAETQAAKTVAELCVGLPLALRIAGSRLATRPHWRIADLAVRLADSTDRLDELSVGDLSVRATFAVSYTNVRSCPELIASARAFRLLGLWPGPDISTPAAAAVFGVDLSTAEQALETLLDEHLLQAAGSAERYRLHGLPSVYAAERAREEESMTERQAAIRRLLAWYLHSAVAADEVMAPGNHPVPLGPLPEGIDPYQPSDSDQALQWLKTELRNLHAAAKMAAVHHYHETAWRLAAALRIFYIHQGP